MTEISLNVSVKVSELYVILYDLNMRKIWSKKCASQLSLTKNTCKISLTHFSPMFRFYTP